MGQVVEEVVVELVVENCKGRSSKKVAKHRLRGSGSLGNRVIVTFNSTVIFEEI